MAWEQIKRVGARNWPTVQGTIESGEAVQHRTRYGSYYVAVLAYSYTVAGEYYSGFYHKVFLRESSADKFIASLKGKMVFVRHNADKPDRSTLFKSDQFGGWPA